jgi:DNA repair protein RecN (Recombination protein N)
LQVRNLAVIDEVELELASGMTVFTGETGAGKSILIEALGLALGDRADSSMIRSGCEQATVCAIFAPPVDVAFRALLEEHGIDRDEELLIKRQLGSDGRSRAFINGSPAPLQVLRAIGERVADIHGQHEHHSLLRRDAQRELLDVYGGHDAQLTAVAAACARVRTLEQDLVRLEGDSGNADAEADLLRYQVAELRAASPTAEGISGIEDEHRRLANAGRLTEGCRNVLAALSEEESNAQLLVDRAAHELHGLAKLDLSFAEAAGMLESAAIQIREAEQWLRHYADRLDADPSRIEQIENQIAILHDLARKHRVALAELPQQLARLEQRLYEIEHSAELRQKLRAELDDARKDYRHAAGVLHDARVRTAKLLSAAVTGNMRELGMPGGTFFIDIEALEEGMIATQGSDRIEFQVSTNPGQPLKPLNKVASGGELSRISLAIQVLSAQGKGVPTFVFDEVDVGIGGRVAEIVGRMLRELGTKEQVLCVTHLPQVAALGHHHVQITKTVAKGQTRISVSTIADEQRVDELARMLGGVRITTQTVAHARSLLAHTNS